MDGGFFHGMTKDRTKKRGREGNRMGGERKKKDKGEDIVVFDILKPSACSECGSDLGKGSFLRVEKEKPLCMECADLDHLEFLPSGDAALTRRSRKYSTLSAVVVRFSRARKRYERQGLLVEPAALERAEEECLADEDKRSIARARAAVARERADAEYVAEFAEHIRSRFPACPAKEAESIANHACRKYSGRVGRSAAAKEFDEEAIELAVRARVRHNHTEYDQLLAAGWDRHDARHAVRSRVEEVLERWACE
jgi:hypothetical protein